MVALGAVSTTATAIGGAQREIDVLPRLAPQLLLAIRNYPRQNCQASRVPAPTSVSNRRLPSRWSFAMPVALSALVALERSSLSSNEAHYRITLRHGSRPRLPATEGLRRSSTA